MHECMRWLHLLFLFMEGRGMWKKIRNARNRATIRPKRNLFQIVIDYFLFAKGELALKKKRNNRWREKRVASKECQGQ